MRTSPTNRAGFTLLEVLLAAGLLAIGMSMILGLFNFGSALSRTAELRSVTSGTIESLFHDLEENLFPFNDAGEVGEPQTFENRPVPGLPGVVYSVDAVPNPESNALVDGEPVGMPREWLVTVTVRWQSAGVRRTESWSTIMLREVPFGARMRRRFVATG